MSKPILFNTTASPATLNLATQGNGALTDVISCTVTEERNGAYELEMTYPIDGIHFSEIDQRSLILAKPNYTDDPQLFRVYKITKPLNGVCTVYAQHISYDLSGFAVPNGLTADNLAQALMLLNQYSGDFTLGTTKMGTATFTVDVPSSVRSWLGGKQGSLLDLYGGEWHFDNFEATLSTARGQNRGVTIRYGKNLTELTQEASSTNLYTQVGCYWKSNDGVIVEGNGVSTGIVLDTPRVLIVDASMHFGQTEPTVQQLTDYAQTYIDANNLTVPARNITLDFVQLKGLSERVDLCDTVSIYYEKLGVSATAKCIKTTWDVLQERYTGCEFGSARSTLAGTVMGIDENANTSMDYIRNDIATVESLWNNRLVTAITNLREDLEGQIDSKIETWVQNTAPSTAWTTAELRTQHNGDIWYYTGLSDTTVNGVTIEPSKTYKYNSSTDKWAAYNNPSKSIFDFADGKSTIYYGSTSGTYTDVAEGDYLVDASDGSTYRRQSNAWVKVTDYTSAIASAKSVLEGVIDNTTKAITGNLGGYVIIHDSDNDGKPDEILIMNTPSIATATKVWRWNQGGLGYSSTGYSGSYGTAITADGEIVADYVATGNLNASLITTGVLNADLITTGKITSANGLAYFDLDNNILQCTQIQGPYATYWPSGEDAGNVRINVDAETIGSYRRCYVHIYNTKKDTKGLRIRPGAGGSYDYPVIYADDGATQIYITPSYSSVTNQPLLQMTSTSNSAGNTINLQRSSGGYGVQINTNGTYVVGNFRCSGTKNRIVQTKDYSDRLLYCYETPSPMFGDVGEGQIGDDGACYVWLDPIFAQTISTTQYQVFLQKYGEGECYVAERKSSYFVVRGATGLKFGWELKAKQKDFDQKRLETGDVFEVNSIDYGENAAKYLSELKEERIAI